MSVSIMTVIAIQYCIIHGMVHYLQRFVACNNIIITRTFMQCGVMSAYIGFCKERMDALEHYIIIVVYSLSCAEHSSTI